MEVYDQIQSGAQFSEMAVRYSDSQTALQGGSLGWLKGDELPTLFFDVMDELAAGEVSEPVSQTSADITSSRLTTSVARMNVVQSNKHT